MVKHAFLYSFLALATSVTLGACGSDDSDDAIFSGSESAALGASGNGAACITCHATEPGVKGNSGNNMMDIAYRTSFKGGGARRSSTV